MAVFGLAIVPASYYLLNQRAQSTTVTRQQDNVQQAGVPEKSSEHDYQDIDFAKKMIIVDQQAMQIADLGMQRTSDTRIKDLSSKLYAESKSDSQQYIAWLTEWKETYLNLSDFPEMEGHDMYPTYSGLVELSEIRQIEGLKGEDFDTAFLRLIIKHLEGVIELQTGKTSEGAAVKYADMFKLKEENAKKQKEKLELLKEWLKGEG